MSAFDLALESTPVAVVDFETTGLAPICGCRVVEVAIARAEPGRSPDLVFESLVYPQGPVHATKIHGITDDDVVGAPSFVEIGDEIAAAVEGCVIAAFNASFDMRFWEAEFRRAGARSILQTPPYVCLMYLRPLLGLGGRCDLTSACGGLGLHFAAHQAADDALAGAYLWMAYREAARRAGGRTFGDFSRAKSYKFLDSLASSPLARASDSGLTASPTTLKARTNPFPFSAPATWPPVLEGVSLSGPAKAVGRPSAPAPSILAAQSPKPTSRESARRIYWHALVDVTEDWSADEGEIAFLASLRERYQLSRDEVRALHARLYGERLIEMAEDDLVTDQEARNLHQLGQALGAIGWSPEGQA